MAREHEYEPTEARYKGGADETYVTYDLEQETRGGGTARYPKVKRVYIAGEVEGWDVGDFEKESGRKVHGVKIDYVQTREAYQRKGYEAQRGDTEYEVPPSEVETAEQHFTQIVEVPDEAENVRYRKELPDRYQSALQDVS